jgi:hypothetical protein
LVTITKILVPGYLVPHELLPSSADMPIPSLGPVPFNLICKAKHLQTHIAQPDPSLAHPTVKTSPSVTQSDDNQLTESLLTPSGSSGSWFEDIDELDPSEQQISNSMSDQASLKRALVLKNEVNCGPMPLPLVFLEIFGMSCISCPFLQLMDFDAHLLMHSKQHSLILMMKTRVLLVLLK